MDTWDESLQKFTFIKITDDTTLSGPISTTYPITVKMTSIGDDGEDVGSEEITFNLVIKNPCTNPDKITLTPGTQPAFKSDSYSDTTVTHTWDKFTISPTFCAIVISCNSVSPSVSGLPCQPINGSDSISWNVGQTEYESGNLPPNKYTYTYDYSVDVDTITGQFEIEITFADPCDTPTITKPAVGTLDYTISDVATKLELSPEYSVDPSWCPFEVAIVKTGTVIDTQLTLDATKQEIAIAQISDKVTPAGSSFINYSVKTTIITKSYDQTESTTNEVTHIVVVRNPCINTAYLSLNLPATLPSVQYTVETDDKVFDPIAASWDSLITSTFDDLLCGAITCVNKFNNAANDDAVMSWDQTSLTWTANSDNRVLITGGTKSYSLTCELEDYDVATYPSATTSTSVGTITFVDPCKEEYTLTA